MAKLFHIERIERFQSWQSCPILYAIHCNLKRHYDEATVLFSDAKKVIPGGVNSPVRSFSV